MLLSMALLFIVPAWALAPVVDKPTDRTVHLESQRVALSKLQTPGVDIATDIHRELFNAIQSLQQEVMQLRGLVEEQAHELSRLQQQSIERYIDLDRRIVILDSESLTQL